MSVVATLRGSLGFLSILLPWSLRRWVLKRAFGYRIHPTSRIGFSWIFPSKFLEMEEYAYIRHFTVCRGLDRVHIGPHAGIGNANWITGYPRGTGSPLFEDQPDRACELVLKNHAAITARHYIDCTDAIVLEQFSLVAGIRSVLLTHSVDLRRGKQACAAIRIGAYSHVGTNCILLPGASLPDFSVLGANSLLTTQFTESYRLYAGSPARERGGFDEGAGWFTRTQREGSDHTNAERV